MAVYLNSTGEVEKEREQPGTSQVARRQVMDYQM